MKKLSLGILLFLFQLCLTAVPGVMRAERLAALECMDDSLLASISYVRLIEYGQDTISISDDEFFSQAGQVVFPTNQYRLPPNAPLLKQLERDVLPALNRQGYTLARVYIRGAASPEGPYALNKMLGEQRSLALVNFIKDRLTVPVSEDHFNLDVEVEDYRSLLFFLSRAHDNNYAYVKAICDKYLPDNRIAQLKSELQKAQGGRLWQHLLTNYFPSLRTARIMLFFHQVKPAEEVVQEPIILEEQQPIIIEQQPVVVEEQLPAVIEEAPQVLPRREYLSVKTNLLLDAAYMPGYNRWCPIPNIAIEYYPKNGHFTYGASFDCPWWQDYDAHKYFQIRNYQLESRYYLRSGDLASNPPGEGAAFRGLYFQAYAHLGLFGICFDANRGWVGEGAGAGVGFGYVLPLSKNGHWRLELGLQAGFFRCKYDPYQYENPVDPAYHDHLYYYKWTLDPSLFKKRQYRYTWLGPTRIGVTLTYDLLYRRISKKGVSFKNYEIK